MPRNHDGDEGIAAAWRASPILRPALQDEVIARIKAMIEDGTLLPGSRIPERQLCAQLGVSRTPLREAFHVLGTQGLIELQPRRGAVVKRLRADEIDHMFEVLEVLEALAAQLACGLMPDEDLRRVEVLHGRMHVGLQAPRPAEFFEINQQIHEKIVKASGNPVLQRVYEGLSGQIRRIRYMRSTDTQWRVAAAEHTAIMKALKSRNGTAMARAIATTAHQAERVKAILATA